MSILPRNIRVRTAVLIASVLMIFLSVFFAITFVSIRGSLTTRAEDEARVQARLVLQALRPGGDSTTLRLSLSGHDAIVESRLHYVILERRNGVILRLPLSLKDLSVPKQEVAEKLGSNPGVTLDYSIGVDNYRLVSVARDSFIVGAAINTTFISEAEDSMVQAFALSLAIGLFAAIGCGIVVANYTLSPLSALARAARSIASRPSDGVSRLPLKSNITEIGELVRAINALLDSRDASLDQMRNFTADAAHELRTPLTVLKGEIEVELRLLPTEAAHREVLESNLEEVERLISIVQDLLFLAMMESEAMLSGSLPIASLPECVARACERLARLSAEKGIEIHTNVGECAVLADEERLGRLLYNLLLNAIQHSKPNTSIEVTLTRNTPACDALEINDHGSGIPPDSLPHIFDRFYRADKSRSRLEGGAGLGLAIAKSIADHYGLGLRVQSVIGSGTTVALVLPASTIRR